MSNNTFPYNIGIIGAGHLGRSLAKTLLVGGVSRATLKISYSGNTETLMHLQQEGLADAIGSNMVITNECDIVCIAIRPNGIASLKGLAFNRNAIVVSCMAGCEIALLEKTFSHAVVRIMPSSPITIEEHKAVCAIYPENDVIHQLLASAGFVMYPLAAEELFNIFTACVCLPAAFLQMQIDGVDYSEREIIAYFSPQFPLFRQMFQWALALTPFNFSTQQKMAYINRMATPGGITEAIVNSLRLGNGFIAAFKNGIVRSSQIARHINNTQ